jgi:hypothetical protein
VDEHPELCEDFEAGPVRIDLPVEGNIEDSFEAFEDLDRTGTHQVD